MNNKCKICGEDMEVCTCDGLPPVKMQSWMEPQYVKIIADNLANTLRHYDNTIADLDIKIKTLQSQRDKAFRVRFKKLKASVEFWESYPNLQEEDEFVDLVNTIDL